MIALVRSMTWQKRNGFVKRIIGFMSRSGYATSVIRLFLNEISSARWWIMRRPSPLGAWWPRK